MAFKELLELNRKSFDILKIHHEINHNTDPKDTLYSSVLDGREKTNIESTENTPVMELMLTVLSGPQKGKPSIRRWNNM